MSHSELDSLIEQLGSLRKGTTLRGALQTLAVSEPTETVEAKRLCALVRWFDDKLYNFLTRAMAHRPEYPEFTQSARLQAMGPGRYALEESERERLLAEWQASEVPWRELNRQIGEHFAQREGADRQIGEHFAQREWADHQLCAVYHLAAAPDPTVVTLRFEQWYRDADLRFDLAQCSALLEMLRLQQRFRGPEVSAVYRDWSRYFESRCLFADDYYKTGSYFERNDLRIECRKVLEAVRPEQPWIFHIHATGGTGKTMFLRWLLSRDLTLRRIPCARVDFDDFRPLNQVLDRPLRLLVRIVEQWSQQVDGLAPLLEKLNREESLPGWNPAVMDEVKLQLTGAKLKTQLVVCLDTLEDATLSHADWLKECLAALRSLRAAVPGLKLILSGRYDIARRSQALLDGEFAGYEIPRFTKQESHAYLGMRGIPGGAVRDAIVDRAGEDEEGTSGDTRLTGRNPFKLAMFAEIVLQRDFNAQEIYALPRADVAYLLERVIRRIDSQPLRWMIRYGAIARYLTLEFVKCVLLPPLRLALQGKVSDQPAEGLDGEYQDTWKPEPELARNLSADVLWAELKKYARDRGWISLATVDGKPCLRFHPEVLGPTRDLLAAQRILPKLQQRASDYFETGSQQADLPEADWVRSVQEAVFHRFQLQAWYFRRDLRSAKASEAWGYWKTQLGRAARYDAARALKIAAELLGADYAEAEKLPVIGVMTPARLREVHCTVADLLLQDGGVRFAKGHNQEEFLRHVASGELIAVEHKLKPVPRLLATLSRAWGTRSGAAALPVLLEALNGAATGRLRFICLFQAAQVMAEQRLPDAVRLFREALQLRPSARTTGVDAAGISLELSEFYAYEGEHTAVISSLANARSDAKNQSRLLAPVLEREALYALEVGDVDTSAARIAELAEVPAKFHSTPATWHVLNARLALVNGDPFAALRSIDLGRGLSVIDLDVARLKELDGESRATLLEFRAALELFDRASVSYDMARSTRDSARCKVRSATLLAVVMRNFREADAVLRSAEELPGSRDANVRCELLMLKAFTARCQGNLSAAAEVVQQLRAKRERPWPPALRARALLFTWLSMPETPPELFEELAETLSDVQPPTLRDRALGWVSHFTEPVTASARNVQTLMSLFTKSRTGSASGMRRNITRADLLRLMGQRDSAADKIRDAERVMAGIASEAALLLEWELNQARKRLGVETRFRALSERAVSAPLASTTLFDAIRVAAARETQEPSNARGPQRLTAEPGNVFESEKLSWLAALPGATPEEQAAARRYQEQLGWTETARAQGGPGIAIRAEGLRPSVLEAADELANAVARLVRDWKVFAEELSAGVTGAARGPLPETVALEPENRLSPLPWEMATVLRTRLIVHRTSESSPLLDLSPQPAHRRSVLFAGPNERMSESLTVSSGGSIDGLYRKHGFEPIVLRQANPQDFEKVLWQTGTGRTVLIHVACTLRETSSGTYLDFEGTRVRAMTFAVDSADNERDVVDLHLSPSRLDRMLQPLNPPPFVVLDVASPYNLTEAVRMLLLRNRFAAQLFGMGHVRGILGCGLAAPSDRYQLTRDTVAALMTKSVGETLAGLRHWTPVPDEDVENVLPRFGAALWTNRPHDRLFESRDGE